MGLRFGEIAVLNGFLTKTTLEFFLNRLEKNKEPQNHDQPKIIVSPGTLNYDSGKIEELILEDFSNL